MEKLPVRMLMAVLLFPGCVSVDRREPHEPAICTSTHFVDEGRRPREASSNQVARSWTMRWDDRIDGVLGKRAKSCVLGLAIEDGRIEGTFRGHVLGEHRNDRFSGRMIRGDRALVLVMSQVSDDYECVYQGSFSKRGEFVGVWHDNRGRSGDFRLRRRAPL